MFGNGKQGPVRLSTGRRSLTARMRAFMNFKGRCLSFYRCFENQERGTYLGVEKQTSALEPTQRVTRAQVRFPSPRDSRMSSEGRTESFGTRGPGGLSSRIPKLPIARSSHTLWATELRPKTRAGYYGNLGNGFEVYQLLNSHALPRDIL